MKKILLFMAVIMCLSMVACDSDNFKVTLSYDSSMGSLSIAGEKDTFESGQDVTLKVEPNKGYKLGALLVGDEDVTVKIVNGEYTFKIKENTNVKAEFLAEEENSQDNMLVLDYDNQAVLPEVSPKKDMYSKGDTVTVTIKPQARYSLTSVRLNGEEISLTKCKYTFTIEQKTTLSIEAEQKIVLTSNLDKSKGKLQIRPNKTEYEYGDEVTITVIPNKGFKVRSFFVGGKNHIGDSADYSCKINLTRGMCIEAEFKDDKEYVAFLDDDNFDDEIKNGKVLVEFGATWCGPCRFLVPLLEDLSELNISGVKCYRVDIDISQDLKSKYVGTAVPVLVIFDNGQMTNKYEGWNSDNTLEDLLEMAEIIL